MFSRSSRAKPTSVMPAADAVSTASEEGADTATTVANPAAHAFCTISKLARPLTNRPRPVDGQRVVEEHAARRPCRQRCGVRCPRARRPARRSRRTRPRRAHRRSSRTGPAPRATRPGTFASTSRSRANGVSGVSRAQRSSSVAEPHSPHDDVVVVSRGVGTGRDATGLDAHDVELGLDRRAGAAVAHGLHRRAASSPSA